MNFDNRPPLPEPVKRAPEPGAGARPPELDTACILLAVLALVGAWLLDPAYLNSSAPAMSAAQLEAGRSTTWILTALYGVLLWFFWRGRNWARVVLLVFSAMSLFNIFSMGFYANWSSRVFLLLDVVVSAYLLFWLMRPEVMAYFKSDKNAAS